jgi:Flp pilus assembly protein TadD
MARLKKRPKQEAAAAPMQTRSNSLAVTTAALILLVIGALTAAAHARNSIYQTYVTLWKSVSESSPNKRRAHENYGQALSTAGSMARTSAEARRFYDEALRQFQTVIALRDDGSVPLRDLYREIGVVQFRMEQYDEAISTWQTGLRYAPYDPSLLNNLSIALMQKGRFEEAATAAETALTVDPGMPQALNTLGQSYMAKGDYEHAAQYFLKAIEREPDVAARYWNAALALEQARKYEQALQYATQYVSIERDPVGRQRGYGYIEHLKQALPRR